jgi:2-keto-3-deoxy-L-fuconate dehydrogenase
VRLAGKIAVVTGAGSGIGRATALRLAREGARVVAADLSRDAVEDTVAQASGAELAGVTADVRDEDSIQAMFVACADAYGERLDVLANIAGVGSTTSAPETPLEVWEDVFSVNARGTFLCCKHAIPRMIAGGGGSIVNMASVAGLVGLRNRAAYCASKGAEISFTRAVALDHIGEGVRVNCICPGTVDSPWVRRLLQEAGEPMESLVSRQPIGRLGTPDEIAAAVLYVASDEAGFMTGGALVIDGGLSAG